MPDNAALVFLFPHLAVIEAEMRDCYDVANACWQMIDVEANIMVISQAFTNALLDLVEGASAVYAIVAKNEFGGSVEVDEFFGLGDHRKILSGYRLLSDGRMPLVDSDWVERAVGQISHRKLVIAGFHFCDCALRVVDEALDARKEIEVAPLATDLAFELHRYGMRSGTKARYPVRKMSAEEYLEYCWRLGKSASKNKKRTSSLPVPRLLTPA